MPVHESDDSDFESFEVDNCKITSLRKNLLETTLICHVEDVKATVRCKVCFIFRSEFIECIHTATVES